MKVFKKPKTLAFMALILVGGIFAAFQSFSPAQGAPTTANFWVDANGGTCSQQLNSGGAYSDSGACVSIDMAWQRCSPGQTIVVKANANTYLSQRINSISGTQASPGCRVIGEDGVKIAGLDVRAQYFSMENIIIDVGNSHGYNVSIDADDVKLQNVSLYGQFISMAVNGNNFMWKDGSFGQNGTTGGIRRCDQYDGQGVWLDGNGATFDGIRFNPQKAAINTDPSCGLDNTFHLELIRVQGAQNLTVKNSWFLSGSDAGSGHIFVTNTDTSSTAANGLKLINNIFEPVNGSYALQTHTNVLTCNWQYLYNTFYQPMLLQCTGGSAMWVGNIGSYPGCSGTHIKNVFYRSTAFTCGSDLRVSGSSMSSLGLGSGGKLNTGSPAIDAAEPNTASDYCTGPDVGSRDIDNNSRPQGSNCDAGADEFFTGSTPPQTCSAKQGDVNKDGLVDVFDLSILLSAYGKPTTECSDINRDGKVDMTDLSVLLTNYGT